MAQSTRLESPLTAHAAAIAPIRARSHAARLGRRAAPSGRLDPTVRAALGVLLAAVLAAGALLAGWPPAVRGAAPSVVTDLVILVECTGVTTAAGTVQVSLAVPRDREADASVGFWAPDRDPATDPPNLLGFQHFTLHQSSPLTVAGDIFMFDPLGSAEFLAPITVEVAPAGPIDSFSVDERFGNVTTRMTFGTEPMTVVAGQISLGDGPTFDLTTCTAARGHAEIWQTAPTATVIDGATVDVECTWEMDGLFAVLVGALTPFAADAVLFVETASGSWGGGGPATIDASSFDAQLELVGETSASASVDVSLAASDETSTYMQVIQNVRTRVTDTALVVGGSVTVTPDDGPSIELAVADADCSALHSEFHGVRRAPTERVPAAPFNDDPSAALPLSPGGAASVHTGGTALANEAPASCIRVDGEVDPFVHTVWYTVAGTGGPMTIDTAHSDFDTGIAVYIREADGAFTEVACSDTVLLEPFGATHQGRVTFATEAGTIYWVQAGGFLTETGHLRLRATG